MERPLNSKRTPAASDRPASRSKLRRVFNLRLLIETLIVAAVVGPAVYAWYYYQVQNTAAAMLEQAEKLTKDGKDAEAAQYYYDYLKLKPGNADVQVLLAETYDRASTGWGEKPQAVEYYYQALGVAPAEKLRGLRGRLAELLIELRRFVPAEEEAREILQQAPNDVEGNRLLAMALFGQSRSGSLSGGEKLSTVGEAVENAWKMNPADMKLAGLLADIYRNQPELVGRKQQDLSDKEKNRLADEVMDQMVAAKPKDSTALLVRHRYQLRYHSENQKKDLDEAIQENPDDLAVVLQAAAEARYEAKLLQREGGGSAKDVESRFNRAQKHYEHAIELSPAKQQAYLGLADLFISMNKLDRAEETLRRGIEKVGQDSFGLKGQLAEVLMGQGQLDEADKTITELERMVAQIAPIQPRPIKLALKRRIDSLRGGWLASKGRFIEAVPVLRRVAVGQQTAVSEIARSMNAWQLLGKSYAALGQLDQAAIAFEQIALLNPKAVAPHLEAAAAWTAANRPDAAEQHYLQALALKPSQKIWLALARTRLQKELRSPVESRNWDSFNRALAEAKKQTDEKSNGETGRGKLIEIEYLIARSQDPAQREQSLRDALALCSAVEREHPGSVDLLPSLAVAYERLDKPEDSNRIVKRLEGTENQKAVACLLKAKFLTDRKQYEQARKALTAGLETLPATIHPALRLELAQLALSEGHVDQAREQILELQKAHPDNIRWTIQLAEMSFGSGKPSDIEKWEKELRQIEGENGLFWRYFQARRLLAEAAGPDDVKLVEAAKLQTFIQSQRPAWSRVHLLLGMLSEARGNFDQAMDAYKEAIRLGERQPSAYQRLISLLLQTNQAGEADHYLSLMQDQAAPTNTVSSLESVVAARRGENDRALESARLGVRQRPKDPLAKLWLGQLLLAADKSSEAETTLKEALDLAPDDPRTLGGLFGFYLRANRSDDARGILKRIAENKKLEQGQRAAFLARGYEALGDQEQALANYREAARLDEADVGTKVRLAGYLLRSGSAGDASEPERLLRDAVSNSPDYAPARRMLAQLLFERGGKDAWEEARRLAEEPGKEGLASDVDRRLQAALLARRGGKENLDQARLILEELVANPKKAANADRRMLARLYEADGRVESARQQYLKLISRENASQADVISYIGLLLRYEMRDEADERLKKLETDHPDDLSTAILRARWLRGKNQTDKIEPLLEPLVEKAIKDLPKNSPAEAKIMLSTGNLYSTLDLHKPAERWYRRLIALRPEAYPPLVNSLAKQGRMREALDLCNDAAKKSDDSSTPAKAAIMALLAGNPSTDDFALAEPLLAKAAADHKDDADLLTSLASIRVVQRNLDGAAGLFRQVLALKPDDVPTLNNLATVLAEQPDNRQEAIGFIDLAIEIVGPQPGLLDTKAMIMVLDDKPADAIPLLEQAASSPLTDPRYHFHLAVAYDRAGRPEKARAAYQTALKNHLTRQILTPTDQSMLAELKKKYD